jgi:hypothetical protein
MVISAIRGGAGEAKPPQKDSKPPKNHTELYNIILINKKCDYY